MLRQQLNGRAFDATLAEKALLEIDQSVNDFLSGKAKTVAPAVDAPEETPAEAGEEEVGSGDEKNNT